MKPSHPDHVRQQFEEAFALHRQGRASDAFARYAAILAADPRHAPALHYSALLLHQQGRSGDAVARIESALEIDATVADVWVNAGMIYGATGRAADASRALERATALEPTLVEAWLGLSSQRLAMNEPVAAEAAARKVLALAPAPVLLPAAATTEWRASAIGAWFNLALALAAQRRVGEALAALDQLEATIPVGEPLNPAIPGIRAQLLIEAGRPQAARRVLDEALSRVDEPALRLERARLAEAQGDLAGSLSDYETLMAGGVAADTLYETALSDAIFLRKRLALWDGLPALQASFRQRVARHRYAGDASLLTPFSFLSDPSTRLEQRVAAEAWSRRYVVETLPQRPLSAGRLRVGYLSADLHDHATGILAVGLFEQHDRERFEVIAYSTGPDDGSALRKRLVAAFDRFVDARGWPDAQLARRIAPDGIDILVDLKGHTERAPTGVMALRPAPIAVSYLGYPGTMGASFVDYLIGDRIVTPLAHANDYSETLVQLPHSYQINDDRRAIAASPSRADLGLPDDAVVLCCFNNAYKINADVLDAWVEILRRAPKAVAWMQTRGDAIELRARLLQEVAARGGVEPGQIVFADMRPHAEYLALYRCADLYLDTWPYNAHTTASDALWAGCPVLTMAGETFAGRVAASLLTALGTTQGIVPDRANYIATAASLASDRGRLAQYRAQVGARLAARPPLFDTRRTTRAIEAAYQAMARQHRRGRRSTILVNDDLSITD